MTTDMTFFTNEKGRTLLNRFEKLLKSTKFFDCLVGYFYSSGFYKLYRSLENTEKIRILIGIGTSKQTYEAIQEAKKWDTNHFSHVEVKERFAENIVSEMETSPDQKIVEEGIEKFKEWIRNGKLEIKAYPSEKIHAKIYIITFFQNNLDEVGRVITGSSNFTQSGLQENLEFNVELKNATDHDFALKKFNELWANAVDVSKAYINTIDKKTWLNDTLTPHDLYLKFLYEYFKEKINLDYQEIHKSYLPEDFLDLDYQKEAVSDAKEKLDEYGGVFISDVVGLGKTFISALLAQQLDGRNLVIAPPTLLDENNPGSWKNIFSDFRVPADYESLGKLEKLLKRGTEKYKNIFIDEAHRFRTETNITYEKLARICRGKRIILVSATPFNNSPKDILSQIKLFQKTKKSTIPNLRDLESFFSRLEKNLKNIDRQKDREEYIRVVKENAKEIRDKILKYIMVRRTRSEVEKYFSEDLRKRKLKFPEVVDPEAVLYEFNKTEDSVFTKTIELIAKKFKYARYMPLSPNYYTGPLTQPQKYSSLLLLQGFEKLYEKPGRSSS